MNRMQIVETGGCGFRYEQDGYFDSIVANNKACKAQLHFGDFKGRIVVHCHKLKDEDRGMMVCVNVTGGPGEGVSAYPQENCLALAVSTRPGVPGLAPNPQCTIS